MNLQPQLAPAKIKVPFFCGHCAAACSATASSATRGACFSNSSDSTSSYPPNTCCPPKLFDTTASGSPRLETKSPQSHNQKSPCADESRSNARRKPESILRNLQVGFRQASRLHPPHLRIRAKQQIQLCLQRNFERILAKRALPAIDVSCSSAITTSLRLAIAEAFAIDTACAAQAVTPSRVNRSVEANPQAPLANTRIPSPIDSDCASVPTCPFFVVRSRCRRCITRTSAYFAPRTRAVSKA